MDFCILPEWEAIKTKALEGWSRGKWIDIYYHKAGMITLPPNWKSTPTTRNMEGARPILTSLAELFRRAYESRSKMTVASPEEREGYDDDTAGGILTYESFRSCLI